MDLMSILKDFVVPTLMMCGGFLFGRSKNVAETRKAEAEAQKINVETELDKVDLYSKLSLLYKTEINALSTKVNELTSKIEDMEKLIGDLKTNQCYDTTCTLRKYNPKTKIVRKQ
jgi:hypothetical protein